MPYTVAGTLKLPETGQPAAGVILKFIALQSISPVLDRFESVIVTSSTGAYSIQLEYNTYSVFATLYDNKPINCGQIVLNSTVATGLDLPTLLNDGFSEPTTPSWIVELQRLAGVTTKAAQDASTSASTATTKASQAATSATGAASSATTATSKASEAATSASTATTKATDAATSASTATSRATAAANSATEAANSAATATTKASEAAASATSAATKATAASTSASQAATSATASSTSATASSTSASQAAASAAAAAASAAQASQISGLSTVAEAIGLAALPLPDVSIPFTTDGRMTRGKGAPVLVGTTPVAQLVTYERLGSQTMIDKSGRLVTVPAGEMAIEQQGLAIFDQSVNLAAPSINWAASANMAAAWTHGTVDASGWIAVSGSGDPSKTEGSYKDFTVPTTDTPHTFSLDILKKVGLNVTLRTFGHGSNGVDVTIAEAAVSGSGAADVVDMGAFWRVELTRTFTNTTTKLFRIYPFGPNIGSTGSMTYRRVQLEAKPFATPYIDNATSAQTTRPATTRCDIPWPGNMQPLTNWQELTISFEFDIAGLPAAGVPLHIFVNGSGGNYLLARIENNGVLRFYRSASSTHQHTLAIRRRYKMCYRINRNLCDLFIDGVRIGGSITASPVTTGLPDLLRLGYSSSPGQCLNGHLRNINIWNTPLTDAQCVAASS